MYLWIQLDVMKKRISLKDIAQKVGVSTALVSYVLNNRMQGRIREEVVQKIKKVAASPALSTKPGSQEP
jgi:DNA-binding LacI/PurR family transcriptional regulator